MHESWARTHRAGRRLLRHPQALSERRLLLGDHLPGHGLPAGDVYRAVRHSAGRWLAGAVERNDPGPGTEDLASTTALHRSDASQTADHAGREGSGESGLEVGDVDLQDTWGGAIRPFFLASGKLSRCSD